MNAVARDSKKVHLSKDSNPRKIMAGAGVLKLDDLPDGIKEKILTHLPMRDAARTSILSKEWEKHWRNIPSLVFDNRFHRSESAQEQTDYLLDMSHVLLHHRGSIHKFTLSMALIKQRPQIDSVMLFLCDKDVHEFTFDVGMANPFIRMPSYLFSYQQLRHLDLIRCEFKVPHTFEGFPHLISLGFCLVIFPVDDETLPGDFISKCPLLENLSINGCKTCGRPFIIDAPKLKFLDIDVDSFFFNNTPLLSSVHVEYRGAFGSADGEVDELLASKLIRFFECLPVVEYLYIGNDFGYTPQEKLLTSPRLPITICHLKVLAVEADFSRESGILLVLALIISSPNLQKLMVTPDLMDLQLEGALIPVIDLFKREDLLDVTFQNLHELQMTFYGTSMEVEFIEFMLAKSVVLKTVTFYHGRKYKRRISIVVAKLASASPKVKINLVEDRNVYPYPL